MLHQDPAVAATATTHPVPLTHMTSGRGRALCPGGADPHTRRVLVGRRMVADVVRRPGRDQQAGQPQPEGAEQVGHAVGSRTWGIVARIGRGPAPVARIQPDGVVKPIGVMEHRASFQALPARRCSLARRGAGQRHGAGGRGVSGPPVGPRGRNGQHGIPRPVVASTTGGRRAAPIVYPARRDGNWVCWTA